MRRWAVLAILTYFKYVPVAALRPPSLTPARYALEVGGVWLPIGRDASLRGPS